MLRFLLHRTQFAVTVQTVLEYYPYTDFITWDYTPEKVILVLGNITMGRKLIFKTTDGKPITDLIRAYLKAKAQAPHTPVD